MLRRTICAALVVALSSGRAAAQDSANEPGFAISTWASGLDSPVAMEFAPDGRLFVAEQKGAVRVVDSGGLLSDQIVAQFEVYYENENGLLGLALDPDFADNGYIYVFATIDTKEQRIYRIVDPQRRRSAADDEPLIIRDHLPTRGEFHSGGGLKVGPDRKLYFSIGDNLIAENAQDMNTLAGKISRINLDGSTPADNPFRTTTGTPRAIFALGFRNPFRFCFAPDGRMFALDVGSDGDGRREEINLVVAGENYGWPIVEGPQSGAGNPDFTDPIYSYHEGGAAPVGAVFYTGGHFPSEYHSDLFHLEYVLGRLYRTVLSGNAVIGHWHFASIEGGPVDLVQGPDGALYICTLFSGEIKRVYSTRVDANPGSIVAGDQEEAPPTAANQPVSGLCGTGGSFALFGGALALTLRRGR